MFSLFVVDCARPAWSYGQEPLWIGLGSCNQIILFLVNFVILLVHILIGYHDSAPMFVFFLFRLLVCSSEDRVGSIWVSITGFAKPRIGKESTIGVIFSWLWPISGYSCQSCGRWIRVGIRNCMLWFELCRMNTHLEFVVETAPIWSLPWILVLKFPRQVVIVYAAWFASFHWPNSLGHPRKRCNLDLIICGYISLLSE